MASFNHSLLITFISIHLSAIATTTAIVAVSGSDIHDILPHFGLPRGILPDAVESYTLSPSDGAFDVNLTSTSCYVLFDDQTFYYNKNIRGKLSYRLISDVTGIQAKQFFSWLSVTDMFMDINSNMIEFHVEYVSSKKLPADMFLVVPDCKSKACPHEYQSQSI